MKRSVSIIIILGLVGAAGAVASGAMSDDAPTPTTCSEGYTSWEAGEGMYDGSVPPLPLEQAMRQQLQEVIPVDVPESSVERARISSSGEKVEARMADADGQPVVLHLKRHQDGYIDGGATWCAPDTEP